MAENGSLPKVGSCVSWLAVKGFLAAASPLPHSCLLRFLRALSTAFHALRIRRRVVRENLRAAFGDGLPEAERDRIARACYAEWGRNLAEIVHTDRLVRRKEELFELRGLEHIEEARRGGTGILFLTAHMGNFLLAGHYLRSLGYPTTFVSKRIANPYLNREIEAVYGRHGSTIIEVQGFQRDPKGGIRLFRRLKEGDIVFALVDQDAGPEGYISSFFGIPTSLPSGPVRLAVRCGAPALTGFVTREGGRIVGEIGPRIDYSAAGSPEDAVKIVLDGYSRRLEEAVRKAPEQYFWFHKKWKSVPEIRARYEGAD